MIGSFFKFITPICCRSNRAVVENNNTERNGRQNSDDPVEVIPHIIPSNLRAFVDASTTAVEISSAIPIAYAKPVHDDNIKGIPYNNTEQDEILITAPPPTITRKSTIFQKYQEQQRLALEETCVDTFPGASFVPDRGIVL